MAHTRLVRSATRHRHRPLPSRRSASLPCSDPRSAFPLDRSVLPSPAAARTSQPASSPHSPRVPSSSPRARASPHTPMPQISYHQHHADAATGKRPAIPRRRAPHLDCTTLVFRAVDSLISGAPMYRLRDDPAQGGGGGGRGVYPP